MDVTAAVRERLANDATLSALVGDRVRPLQLLQDEPMPYVVFERAAREPTRTMDGDDLSGGSVQVRLDCYASTYSQCVAVKDLSLGLLLDAGWTQSLDGSVSIKGVFLLDDQDAAEYPVHGEDLAAYHASVDVTVYYTQGG